MAESALVKLLNREFLKWEQASGRRKSLLDWYRWLGLKQSTMTMIMNGINTPSLDTVVKLAAKLGPQVFLAAGYLPPEASQDGALREVLEAWPDLPDRDRAILLDQLRRMVGGREDDDTEHGPANSPGTNNHHSRVGTNEH